MNAKNKIGSTLESLNKYWNVLKSISVEHCHETGMLCIEEPFLHFDNGTNVEDIWHWFEDQNPYFQVAKIMY
ncbi:hypothetical protein [Xenorhabdus bovienii]|uniref:Uncharacterized protein n=1 Tax=Xenorhabdus bovienii str. feltiae Moldova TaxID=1398200 RepID=A0A077NEA5_XENBV|nr:hypothetical protein [Xenorhabdus bovienii]CDH00547.1 conserved hypothetical protein [Xenorhabdus bovienii str. feltiae Moldova]